MASSNHNSDQRNRQKRRPIKAPFGVLVPSSLRDPKDTTISIEQLARLTTVDDTRDVALGHLHDHDQFATFWNSNKPHPDTRRAMRRLVQIQTINAVCHGFYRLPNGTKISLDNNKMSSAARNTKPYENDYMYDSTLQKRSYEQPARILVVDGDCLDVVMCFKNKYPNCNPVVLNMASANNPGGWLEKWFVCSITFQNIEFFSFYIGAGAQEENLHRRTNMFQCLEDPYRQLEEQRQWRYHVPEFGGIYSPDVSVFRGAESNGYPFFPDGPQYISFIACAAYSHPPTETDKNGELKLSGKNFIQNMKQKMEAILKIALENKHDIIILSALGCGAYQNPPRHIAQLFRDVLSKYSQSFKYIVFAIINDHNAKKAHNPLGNIQPFAEIFNVDAFSLDELREKLSSLTE